MTYASEVLADVPFAYYRLDDASGSTTASDSSGNGRNLSHAAGAVAFGAAPLINDGSAATFDTSDELTVSPATIATTATTSLSIEAWVKTTSAAARIACGWARNVDITVVRFALRQTSTGLPQGTLNTSAGTFTVTGATGVNDGVRHHLVLVLEAGVTLTLYVDGVAEATTSVTGGSTDLNRVRVGGSGSSSTRWSGDLDEVAFYASPLSSGRVAAHYAAGTGAAPPISSTLSATLPAKAAAFTLDAPGSPDRAVELVATLRRRLPTFSLLAAGDLSLDATMRRKVAGFSLSAMGSPDRLFSFAATLQPKVATFISRGVTPVTSAPPSVAAAAAHLAVVANAHGPATVRGTRPVYTVSQASAPRARQQIVVDGVDVTYFRGAPTPDVDYTLLEPLLYGPGTLDLPQVRPYLGDTPGAGDLTWLRPQAPVEVHLVVDDVVVKADVYKGFIAAFDINAGALSVEVGGEANGRAAMRDRQVPIFPRTNDIGHQIADAVRDLGLPHYPSLGVVTGIETMTTGGTGHLDHIDDLVAKSWTRSGKQWTVMPNETTGAYETHRKDATTVHGTVFLDDVHTVANLRRDISEEPNQIFVTCVTPAGMRVRFGKYPGLVQGPVPDFPGHMVIGDTGEGVRLLIGKLHASGYLKLSEVAGGFDQDVAFAVLALQADAGLPETGEVNLATWEALYDLNVTGLSLEWANIQPAAQRSKTRKFNRSANGTIMGFNPDYDPDVIVRHRSIDLGSGVTRSQAREFARTVLHDSDAANWVGDIRFDAGALIRGEGAEGMVLTPSDVMDAREVRPGMNLWLPQFDDGTLVHVSACQVNQDGIVTATVDTRFRDAMEVWQVIARNKESRNDPSRHRQRRWRASTIVKDSIGEWDEIGGLLGVDLPLETGWNVFPVVAAMEGQIRRLRIILDDPAEFACAVFGSEISKDRLDNLIPAPLTVNGTKDWERAAVDSVLQDHLILYSAGTHDEPCGYGRGRKSDGDPLTGVFNDRAGFPYFAADRTAVWVAVWVGSENLIGTGRIMWPQLEAGV